MSSVLIADSSRAAGLSGRAGDAGVAPHEPSATLVCLTPALPKGALIDSPAFPKAATRELKSETQRKSLYHAAHTIRNKRIRVTDELNNWEEIQRADEEIKNRVARHLSYYLEQFERNATAAGATLHWAHDAEGANQIAADLVKWTGESGVTKVGFMVTQETDLNEALGRERITVWEVGLAELIVRLGHDRPSHVLVLAIHRSRGEVHEIFLCEIGQYGTPCPPDVTDDPVELAGTARIHLRGKSIRTKVRISGASFAIAETGSLMVVESEGNGRVNLTLPEALISLVGIEKILPTFQDLEVFLQLLPRSSTRERVAPYGTIWTGKRGEDGPKGIRIVLLNNGHTKVLRDKLGYATLRCIRCSTCLDICLVYEKVDGHAHGSMYPGLVGAILDPQLRGVYSTVDHSLPFASTLCGAHVEICPMRIPFIDILVDLRRKAVGVKYSESGHATHIELLLMKGSNWVVGRGWRLALAGHLVEITGALLRPFARKIGK